MSTTKSVNEYVVLELAPGVYQSGLSWIFETRELKDAGRWEVPVFKNSKASLDKSMRAMVLDAYKDTARWVLVRKTAVITTDLIPL